jgi:hypothetical protein
MNKQLVMTWRDLAEELGGDEIINEHKLLNSNYNNEHILQLIEHMFEVESEHLPTRPKVEVVKGEVRLLFDDEVIVYASDRIDYRELLISLLTLIQLTNQSDRVALVIHTARALLEIDREVAEQFRVDIAERVYRTYK